MLRHNSFDINFVRNSRSLLAQSNILNYEGNGSCNLYRFGVQRHLLARYRATSLRCYEATINYVPEATREEPGKEIKLPVSIQFKQFILLELISLLQ